MSNTFGTAITDLLDYVNRPVSESGARAAREINNAIRLAQRRRIFKRTERLFKVTYPANALTINLTDAAGGLPRDFQTVQLLSESGANFGLPLRIKTYDEIISELDKYQRTNVVDEFAVEGQDWDDPRRLPNFIQKIHKYYGFLVNDQFGLYPTPTQDVNLLFNLHIWLPTLEKDSDTNFFLEECYDYVTMSALAKLNLSLKHDARYPITAAELKFLWDSVEAWDGTIGNYSSETR